MGAAEVLEQLAELAEGRAIRGRLCPLLMVRSRGVALTSLKWHLPFGKTEIKMLTPRGCCVCAEPCAQVKGTR